MRVKKPSFNIILFKSKELANGEHPVMIRATFNRERKYYSLGLSALPEAWNDELGRYGRKRLSEDERQANHVLNDYAAKLRTMDDHFSKTEFTFEKFNRLFFKSSNGVVSTYFDELVKQLEEGNRFSSAQAYSNALSKLQEFNKKDFTFLDIDVKFLQQFETFMKKTLSPATRGIYLRSLRAVYNRAIKDSIVKAENYPFKGFRIETHKGRKKALTKEQLNELKAFKAAKGSRLWHSRNLFLFSYYGRGMNLTDIANLTWKDVRNDRIFYKRQKTNDNLDLLIDENLAKIMAEYSGSDFIFPILEKGLEPKTIRHRIKGRLKKANSDLQEIAKTTSVPDDITFYWARHTYATTLKRAGVSIAIIQETLGHSSEAVTKNYLDSFETNQLDKISKYL